MGFYSSSLLCNVTSFSNKKCVLWLLPLSAKGELLEKSVLSAPPQERQDGLN